MIDSIKAKEIKTMNTMKLKGEYNIDLTENEVVKWSFITQPMKWPSFFIEDYVKQKSYKSNRDQPQIANYKSKRNKPEIKPLARVISDYELEIKVNMRRTKQEDANELARWGKTTFEENPDGYYNFLELKTLRAEQEVRKVTLTKAYIISYEEEYIVEQEPSSIDPEITWFANIRAGQKPDCTDEVLISGGQPMPANFLASSVVPSLIQKAAPKAIPKAQKLIDAGLTALGFSRVFTTANSAPLTRQLLDVANGTIRVGAIRPLTNEEAQVMVDFLKLAGAIVLDQETGKFILSDMEMTEANSSALMLAISMHLNALRAIAIANSRSNGIAYPGDDPTVSPGEGFEWRGRGTPESGKGNWYNPRTGERLNPDLDHGPPIGPHWDYTDRDGNKYRLFPDGTLVPKKNKQ